MLFRVSILFILLCGSIWSVFSVDFPGRDPGEARSTATGAKTILENDVLAIQWAIEGKSIRLVSLTDKMSGRKLELHGGEIFELVLAQTPLPEPKVIKSSQMRLASAPTSTAVAPRSGPRRSENLPGKLVSATLVAPQDNLRVLWSAVLRDGSNYIRQSITLQTERDPVEITEVRGWTIPATDARIAGTVEGSPATAGPFFFGFEHPLSQSRVQAGSGNLLQCSFSYSTPLWPGTPVDYSWVAGVTPNGQLRRGFLYYLERERAHPYHQLMHHNNGEDIGGIYWPMITRKEFAQAAEFRKNQWKTWKELIEVFGRELVEKRNAPLDSFCHDYEWDDEKLIWQFHEGFPDGFKTVHEAAKKYGTTLSLWISPMAGYNGRASRMEMGRKLGFEITQRAPESFDPKRIHYIADVAGKRYKTRFYTACLNMLKLYDLDYFKYDGFAGTSNPVGSLGFASQIESLLDIMQSLRKVKPDLMFNPSAGSWPSPFWLLWADATWRNGSDAGVYGQKGSPRQQWISYRDNETYHRALGRGPLYPLSSYMLHGIMINKGGRVLSFEEKDMIDEIRSFFATGTNLQELYIHQDFMSPRMWDVLAEASKWARANEDIMADTHWVGGDPTKFEVYGWASWSKAKAVLALRNPDDKPQTISLDIARAFELPEGAPTQYRLRSPWKEDQGKAALTLSAGRPQSISLEPFQVLVFDAAPVGR